MEDERYDWGRVEDWMEFRGVSLSKLADMLGMHRTALYKIKRGEVAFVKRTASAIAYHLDVKLGDLAAKEGG